ncbi:unnamed protein product [Notodromas monacha]|uniref:beta-N-acetylhexosaminidase n=1 Tax=Notodromas monacha TaxID=399045 RepID=A0A7R9C1A3_9CRUS|nr:unnamed protein product [Notodromas monacha]CAG0924188.1 unnamed protein product [Notodromas monacha]
MLKKAGANALLLEYEDAFPYTGRLANLSSAADSMTSEDVSMFVNAAVLGGFEVIPLVQTFGHLEYVLKLPEFSHLREADEDPADICPSHPEAFKLITEMLQQVMALHEESKYVHIGCDEVFHLAECPVCKSSSRGHDLYLDHVKAVAQFVTERFDANVLIWDDVLRKIPLKLLRTSQIGNFVEPVIWVYGTRFTDVFPTDLWTTYAKAFSDIWTAGAFKGAFGAAEFAPNVYKHLVNALTWQSVLTGVEPFFSRLRGQIFTGWSRYDHFANLCELLPNSLPSALLTLLVTSRGSAYEEVTSALHEILGCPGLVALPANIRALESDPRLWDSRKCVFVGADVVQVMWDYQGLMLQTQGLVRAAAASAWVSDYNDKHNWTSRRRVLDELKFLPPVESKVSQLGVETRRVLSQYLTPTAVEEWMQQKIVPLAKSLFDLETRGRRLASITTWGRRTRDQVAAQLHFIAGQKKDSEMNMN